MLNRILTRGRGLSAVPASVRRLAVTLAILSVAIGFPALPLRAKPQRERSNLDRIVPYVPTPLDIVEKMLELARVDQRDTVYDLGSGDGRIVIMAAQKFGAHAVGVELDSELYARSSKRIADLGLEQRAKILHENMFDVSVSPATVVTLYLLTVVNERLRPTLEKQLRPGARVVTHDFQVPGWTPEKVLEVNSEYAPPAKIYLYVRP